MVEELACDLVEELIRHNGSPERLRITTKGGPRSVVQGTIQIRNGGNGDSMLIQHAHPNNCPRTAALDVKRNGHLNLLQSCKARGRRDADAMR